MGDPSKSLTVTFGTFTCTVIGYEDPFPILRQTVEYLQSVSDSDPEFGTKNYNAAAPAITPGAILPDADSAETEPAESAAASPDLDHEFLTRDEVWEGLDPVHDVDALSEGADAPAEDPSPDLAEIFANPASEDADPAFAEAPSDFDLAGLGAAIDAATDDVAAETDIAEAGDVPGEMVAAEEITTEEIHIADPSAVSEKAMRPEWVDVKDGTDPEEASDTATAPVAEQAAPEAASPESESIKLSFGATPGLDAGREAKLADVPTTPPESQLAPPVVASGAPIFEDDDESSDFEFDIAKAIDPATSDKTNGKANGEPLVLTTEMSVTYQPKTSQDNIEAGPEDTESAVVTSPTEPPVLRLVEAVETVDRENGVEDDETRALRNFADRAGAATLPDLLEASAAYVTLIDGRPSFSRGEILRLLDTISDGGAFSQEARIKSFGALLRGGRIHRVENGEFEMSRKARATYEEAAASAI